MKQPGQKPNSQVTAAAASMVDSARERDSARLQEYEKVVEGLEDLIAVVDRDYRYIIANRTLLKYRNRTLDQIVGHTVREVIGAELFDSVVRQRLDDCFAGKTITFDSKITYPGVGERDVTISQFPIEGPQGVERIAIILRDRTEAKRAEENLATQKAYLEALHKTALGLINRLNIDELLHDLVERACALVGVESGYVYLVDEEAKKLRVRVAIGAAVNYVGNTVEAGKGMAGRIWQTREPLVLENYSTWEHRLAVTGYERLRAVAAVPLQSEDHVVGVLGLESTAEDRKFGEREIEILVKFAQLASLALENARLYSLAQKELAERKQVEEALRQSDHQMNEAQRLAHVGSWSWEVGSNVLTWSQELYAIFGEDPRTFTPTYESYLAHVHPEDREGTAQAVAQCLQDQQPFSNRRRILRPSGEIRIIDSHGRLVTNDEGRPLFMFGACQDVTESLKAEEARRLAEQQYRDIFQNAGEGIFQSTPDGRYLAANPALAQMHAFDSPEELMSERTDITRDAYVDPRRREEFKRLLEANGSVAGFEFELARKDGTTIWASVNARVVRDEHGATRYYEGTVSDITERKRSEGALLESEERYRELFENSRDAIYVHDMSGRYISVNQAAEALSGFSRTEILGKHYSNFIVPTYLKTARENFCRKIDLPMETTYEAKIACKDGTQKSVEVSSRMIYRDGEAIGVQGTVRDMTERKLAQRALQDYSRRLVHAQEAERENIARELHDEIGQALTAITINLQWMQRSGAVNENGQPRINESIEVIEDALRRVRELSLELRPSMLDDLGLLAALSWYTTRYSERTGIEAVVTGDLPKTNNIGRTIETVCFRIAQEALTNTARYSRATRVDVNIEKQNGLLQMSISDDGIGFIVENHVNAGLTTALGLRGMKERALAVGGKLTIRSEVGKGTDIVLLVPTPRSH
ncbi:MAG TPA: PAS domain S-box protein [Pyrinomonadaceae bacterium]|nr:PAS domain S-box protein [Pyrinomonadaceae bacterium]